MDREAWRAGVHGVAESDTTERLSNVEVGEDAVMGTGNPTGRRQFKGRCWAQAFPGAVVRPTRAHLGSPGCVGTCGGHCSSPQPGGPGRGSTGDPHLPHSSKPPGFPLKPAHLDAFLSVTSPLLHLLFLPRRLRGEVCFPNRTCHQQDSEWASQNPPASAGDMGSRLGSGRSPGEGNGNPLQNSCLENPTDRGAWCAAKSRTQLSA